MSDPRRAELRFMLNRWDPIGIDPSSPEMPEDEYDCLELPLLRRLSVGAPAAELEAFLRKS